MVIMSSNSKRVAVFLVLAFLAVHATAEVDEFSSGPIVGIDLGTTYSCVGIYKNGKVEIIPNEQGNRITPSYVSWDTNNERLIGDAAKNQATVHPERTVFDIKRLIGRKYSDSTVQADKKLFPFEIVNKTGKPYVRINIDGGKDFSPEEISAMILQRMKTIAENFLSEPVERAIVTVPAYFNDAQRQATKDAGMIAGLKVEQILNEPTAAALAYGLEKHDEEKNVLVFDLGGGTFDVTVLTIESGIFEVLSTNGDTHLGGEDFDQRVMNFFIKKFNKDHGKNIANDKKALQKLRKEVERVKRVLSSQHQARLEIESLYDGIDFSETLSRARFESINMDLFKNTLIPVKKALKDSGLTKSDIDEVVLVGGSTRIPKVQQLIKDFFNGKEPNRGINPDEAVAYGAAIQAGIIAGVVEQEILKLDITPLSLGIETVGGVMTTIIKRGSTVPTQKSQVFSTYQDNQSTVRIAVYQGERALVKDNYLLGSFELSNIPPAPRGVPQIKVTFEVDFNGILHVSAEDTATHNSQQVTITADNGRLSEADLERMQAEAEEFAEEDRRVKERIEARHALENYAYNLRNSINSEDKGLKEKLDSDQLDTITEAVDDVLEWLEENQEADKEQYDEQRDELSRIANPIMQDAYTHTENEFDDDFGEEFGEEL